MKTKINKYNINLHDEARTTGGCPTPMLKLTPIGVAIDAAGTIPITLKMLLVHPLLDWKFSGPVTFNSETPTVLFRTNS